MKVDITVPSRSLLALDPGKCFYFPGSPNIFFMVTNNKVPPTVSIVRLEDGNLSNVLQSLDVIEIPVKCEYDY